MADQMALTVATEMMAQTARSQKQEKSNLKKNRIQA
jgi:hypothetical protein